MEQSIHLTHSRKKPDFAIIPKAVLRDVRLSYAARGFFAMIWDYPDNWRFYKSNLIKMSPSGRDKLNGLIRELKAVDAIRIKHKRLTHEEAMQKSKLGTKQYHAGQVFGSEWVINDPQDWAQETPLKNEILSDGFSVVRDSRHTVLPSDGKPATKGIQVKSKPINKKQLQQPNCKVEELIFPKQLNNEEKVQISRLVSAFDPNLAQQLLDELAGAINERSIRSTVVGYFRGLALSCEKGQFIPAKGIKVAAARNKQLIEIKNRKEVKLTKVKDVPEKIALMYSVINKSTKLTS